jgi:hypothetical protein
MGFRFQRRIRIFRGLTLNLSKSGVGISAGVRGFHTGIDAKGRRYTSAGLPGTGISWRKYHKPAQKHIRNLGVTPAALFCPGCGTPYPAQAKFCSRCGHRVTNQALAASARAGQQRALTITIVLVILAVAFLALAGRAAEPSQIPSWLGAFPGSTEEASTTSPMEVSTSYTARATPLAVSAYYQDEFRRAGIAFQASFDGIGPAIRASAGNAACVVRIREQDSGAHVSARCVLLQSATPAPERSPNTSQAPSPAAAVAERVEQPVSVSATTSAVNTCCASSDKPVHVREYTRKDSPNTSQAPSPAAAAAERVEQPVSVSATTSAVNTCCASSDKPVHVREYTRKDGTVVHAHDRAAPGTRSKN